MPTMKCVQIAIVGAGPRGTSCLERICASASQFLRSDVKLIIHVIDPYPPGPGSVWRIDQPPRLLMNTIASQVTLFTDEKVECEGPHGQEHWVPSFYEWGKDADGFRLGPEDYATRSQHGLYLNWAFYEVCIRARNSPKDIDIKVHRAKALNLSSESGNGDDSKQILTLNKDRGTLAGLSAVILTQGHVGQRPNEKQTRFTEFAKEKAIQYFAPCNPADIDFSNISSQDTVLLRGGWFQRIEDDTFTYHKSGSEPTIYAGSRRGIPYHTKGDNQKANSVFHKSVFLTEAVAQSFLGRNTRDRAVSFDEEVWPLITKEVKLVYYKTLLKKVFKQIGRDFTENDHKSLVEGINLSKDEYELLGTFDLPNEDIWSWDRLQKPQGNRTFDSEHHWNDRLRDYLQRDVDEAKEGNVNGPLKAALDVLRDIRNDVRRIVNHQVLDEPSYEAMMRKFTPLNSFLSVGPPRRRVEQMIALMKAGVLKVLGPKIEVQTTNHAHWLVTTENPRIEKIVSTVIDAFIPPTNLANSADPLLRDLLTNGQCRAHIIGGHATGAIGITDTPYNIVNGSGNAHPRRFAVGVPAEGLHWLTTIQPRPCADSISLRQTDAMARAALERAAHDQTQLHTQNLPQPPSQNQNQSSRQNPPQPSGQNASQANDDIPPRPGTPELTSSKLDSAASPASQGPATPSPVQSDNLSIEDSGQDPKNAAGVEIGRSSELKVEGNVISDPA